MDWHNIDLDRPVESAQNLLDPYTFDTLLLEISCNLKDITPESVKKQAMASINQKYFEAVDTLKSNLDNITRKALKDRAIK